MRILPVVILYYLLSLPAFSQEFPSEIWHNGKMVLVSEDTLVGNIKYDLNRDIVQVKVKDKTFTYSAQKIFFFEIFDIISESYREFYVLPYGLITSYKAPVIFEVLVRGNITLLCREYIGIKNVQNPYSYGSYSKKVLEYYFYFLDREGDITKYTLKKRDLYTVIAKKQNQVLEFIKANRLSHENRNDLVRIINFYNTLL